MKRFSFGRSQSWSDRLGKHSAVDIRDDDKVIGKITGESGVGIPMMQYDVELPGARISTSYSLKEAKAKVMASLTAGQGAQKDGAEPK